MNQDIINKYLVEIEATLVCFIRPSFLTVLYETSKPPYIHIIISHHSYRHLGMVERIKEIYVLLTKYNSDILKNIPVIVEAFSSTETESFFEYL